MIAFKAALQEAVKPRELAEILEHHQKPSKREAQGRYLDGFTRDLRCSCGAVLRTTSDALATHQAEVIALFLTSGVVVK